MQMFFSRFGLIIECAFLAIGVPLLMDYFFPIRYLLPGIWVIALYCYLLARFWMHEPFTLNWGSKAFNRPALVFVLARFAVCALLMLLLTWFFKPELLFNFVREKPWFWLLVMLLYPLLSVLPQEIIFRSFFFARYKRLFPKPVIMVTVSALAFGFAHILFHNWVAPLLCLIGGFLFAHTYQKHQSLLLVALEHALYGDLMFTVGLGRYFFHGSVAAAVTVAKAAAQ